jgi:L-fuconolactonase
MKLDAHQHFWIWNSREFGWMDDRMKVLKSDHLPGDLLPVLEKSGVSGTICVQARQTTEETRWLLKLAEDNSFIKGIVGWVDLSSEDDLKNQLDEFCRNKKFVGVRHVIHDEPDDNFILREDFLRGISTLAGYGLSYDLLLFPKHLPAAGRMVSMFPEQRFVLDHISKPLIRDGVLSPWKEDLMRLAENRNVYCKLSGMVTEADWERWKPDDLTPYLDAVFEAFGTDRLMAGSDWPVCRVAADYGQVLEIVRKYIADFPQEVQEKVMGLNCRDFYRISPDPF